MFYKDEPEKNQLYYSLVSFVAISILAGTIVQYISMIGSMVAFFSICLLIAIYLNKFKVTLK